MWKSQIKYQKPDLLFITKCNSRDMKWQYLLHSSHCNLVTVFRKGKMIIHSFELNGPSCKSPKNQLHILTQSKYTEGHLSIDNSSNSQTMRQENINICTIINLCVCVCMPRAAGDGECIVYTTNISVIQQTNVNNCKLTIIVNNYK